MSGRDVLERFEACGDPLIKRNEKTSLAEPDLGLRQVSSDLERGPDPRSIGEEFLEVRVAIHKLQRSKI